MNPEKNEINSPDMSFLTELDEKYSAYNFYQEDLDRIRQINMAVAKTGQTKQETYQELIENPSPIIWKGFKNNSELSNAPQQIEDVFGKEILNQSLISEVIYQPDTYFCVVGNKEYFIPEQMYQLKAAQLKPHKFRAMNSSDFIIHHSAKSYYRTPIRIFAFDQSEGLDQKYLQHIKNPAERKRLYKIGTINHEIGHHIVDIIVKQKEENWHDWQRIVFENPEPITLYSQKYCQQNVFYSEEFAEAIRLYTTSPQYLQDKYPKSFNYVQTKFPEIKSIA